jgi:DNA-binding beta-propeller fold protein YncE
MANTFARAKSVTVENANATLSVATTVGHGPIADMSVDGDTLVVSNYGDHNVVMLDAATLAVTAGVAAREPFALVAAGGRAHVGVASANYDAVAVIDTRTGAVLRSYPLSFNVTAMAASPDGERVYAGRAGDGGVDVSVIDTTAERVGTIDIASGAGIGIDAITVDPTGKRVYVATTDVRGSQLVVVDAETARVDRKIWIGSPIRDLAFADGTAYVLTSDRANGGAISVVEMSTNRITDTIELGIGAPTQMLLSPDKTRAYVVDYDHVAVVCTLTHEVVTTVTVDARPSCVAVDSDGGRLVVGDYDGDVTVFAVASTLPQLYSQLVATEPIATSPRRELQAASA